MIITPEQVNQGVQALNTVKSWFGGGKSSSAKAAATQYKYNLALQQQAQQWSEYAAKNKWVWDRQAKESAGLNRLYGLSDSAIPGASGSSIGMPEMVSEESSKKQQALEALNMAQNWSAQQVQNEKTKQETKTEAVNTQLKMVEKISKQLDNLYKKKELDSYDKRLKIELEREKSEIIRNLASAGEANANAGTARERTKTEIENRKPTERTNEWYNKHPKLSTFITGSTELTPPIERIARDVATVAGTVLVGNKLNKFGNARIEISRARTAKRVRRR